MPLYTAYHEVGHAVVTHTLGYQPAATYVCASGHGKFLFRGAPTASDWQVIGLAGPVTEMRARYVDGQPLADPDEPNAWDDDLQHLDRGDPLEPMLQAAAIVDAHWARIVHLAIRLDYWGVLVFKRGLDARPARWPIPDGMPATSIELALRLGVL